ncbi:MAG: sugar transferase [Actinomycetota bacterium]|nr:sugar transferase [Actinomycetota bacterium]
MLLGLDAIAITAGWALAGWFTGGTRNGALETTLALGLMVPTTLLLLMTHRLYLARVCSLRAVETERLGRAVTLAAIVAALSRAVVPIPLTDSWLVAGGFLGFAFLYLSRSAYRGWLTGQRRAGRFQRSVVVVGTNSEAAQLCQIVADHPELGFDVIGTIGDAQPRLGHSPDVRHLGSFGDLVEVLSEHGVTGAIVATTAMTSDQLNLLTRTLLTLGIHVHLSSGLLGISHSRLRAQPLAHEPLFYVEPLRLAGWQVALKRAIDMVLGSVGLIVMAPLVVFIAIVIKLDSPGPVFFRQTRVGRNGRHFSMVKLRTMVVDAESRYSDLAATMSGRTGPLVKLREDPRITIVGRFLRATSIDELPQLFNVVMGSMSLVGPRPNLLVEAAGLDPVFLAQKGRMRPGITGLWQVEARDNPSFNAYRRLDLFYLENWSTGLDLAILLATFHSVVSRAVRHILGRPGVRVGSAALALE